MIFAIVVDGELWFKADAETNAIWDAEGCERFTFTGKDGSVDDELSPRARPTSMTMPKRCSAGPRSPREAGTRGRPRIGTRKKR